MSDSSVPHHKMTLRNVFLFFLAPTVAAWLTPMPAEWAFPLRAGMTMCSVVFGFAWFFAPGRAKREAPDILAEQVGSYYEREGLCFAPRLDVIDGQCWFSVFCQNRYGKPCRGTICFIPMEGKATTLAAQHAVAPLLADLECDGGEVGVVRFPYPIGRAWQGKIMVYDVLAKVEYPGGRGELLRTPEGIPVGEEPSSDLTASMRTGVLLALGVIGHGKTASCELQLPENVAETAPSDVGAATEVLWQPA